MSKIIYAIRISELVASGLNAINVKIGQTSDLNNTLYQYRRSVPSATILDVWEINPSKEVRECEQGVHKLAEKYAYEREKETFIFLQDSYYKFRENVNLLLKNVTNDTDKIEKNHKEKRVRRKRGQEDGYTGKSPEAVRFCGNEYKVKTWRDVLGKVAEEIYKEKRDFTLALKIKGRKRIYFSENPKDLSDPVRISETPYFFEGRLSANNIIKLARKLLNTFGYDQNDLEIISKEP